MKIKWLGHACFLITSDSGLQIVTDPYEVGFKGLISYGPVTESPDIVTVSHQHGDHNYTGDLQGSPEIVQGVGKHLVKGIEFVGIPSYHDNVSGQERGDNTIFCFTVDDVKICHCGDLGHPLDDSTISSLGHVNVLLVPTGGPEATFELGDIVKFMQLIISFCVTTRISVTFSYSVILGRWVKELLLAHLQSFTASTFHIKNCLPDKGVGIGIVYRGA